MSIIKLEGIHYQYPGSDEEVLQDINMDIKKGTVHALIGPNGGGKTTLCHVIRGFVPHFYRGNLTGNALLEGMDIREWSMSSLAQKIGYVFQNPFTQISGSKDTVFEEIAFGLENLGINEEVIKEKVNKVLDMLKIEHLREKNPVDLSGGQKQRVALASIITMEPEILVIDEPTSQLDPQGTEEVFKIISLLKEMGKTIVLVEHKIELIAEYADYVTLLREGKIVMEGKTEAVLTDEKAMDLGSFLPQYALLGIELQKQNMDLGCIPLTEKQAVLALNKWVRGAIN